MASPTTYMKVKVEWHSNWEPVQINAMAASVVEKATLDLEGHTKGAIVEVGAVDTGHMLGSVHHQMVGPATGQVIVSAPYSLWVHNGTRFMAGRPFLKMAVDRVVPGFRSLIEAMVKGGQL